MNRVKVYILSKLKIICSCTGVITNCSVFNFSHMQKALAMVVDEELVTMVENSCCFSLCWWVYGYSNHANAHHMHSSRKQGGDYHSFLRASQTTWWKSSSHTRLIYQARPSLPTRVVSHSIIVSACGAEGREGPADVISFITIWQIRLYFPELESN